MGRVHVWGVMCALALARAAGAAEIADPGQGAVEVEVRDSGATGLSGITHVGGSLYYAVGDRAGRLFALDIRLETDGRVATASVGTSVRLARGRDTEGVAWAGDGRVWVSDEVGPAVRLYGVQRGDVIEELAVPRVFARARHNLSLESLALDPETGTLWTANEEALGVDGAPADAEHGSLVRLQRFSAGKPAGQWSYRTDPTPGGPMGGFQRSGLADLAFLPDGTLLSLERGVGARGLRARVFEVGLDGAAETTTVAALAGETLPTATKRLLWEGSGLGDNFEGMALGPSLGDGSRSLVLLSDDGGVTAPRLYPLRVTTGSESLQDAPWPEKTPAGRAGDRPGP